MLIRPLIATLKPSVAHSASRWFYQLGGIGFIPLGLLDSSVVPLPGSMDVLLIVLAARNPKIWFYYAAMATVGSVLGGFVTYRLARKGGKEAVERKVPKKKADKVYKIFDRWGFGAIAIPALLPPPLPIVPFLLAAGALQYPASKFLAALSLGRMIRYAALGYLSFRYGRNMLKFIANFPHPYLVLSILLITTAVAIVFVILKKKRKKSGRS